MLRGTKLVPAGHKRRNGRRVVHEASGKRVEEIEEQEGKEKK